MGFKTRNRKEKHDDKNTIKTCDNNGVTPWSDLNHDVLLLVMMKLGVVDFLAFNGVCKSWRSLAVSNRKKFIVSKPPMPISVSSNPRKNKCYRKDFEGRKFKITLPHFAAGRRCIGVTSGYLILFGQKTKDCWLVNLITRHELYFPDVPDDVFLDPEYFGAIFYFLPSISGWVFAAFSKFDKGIWFCIPGKQKWTKVHTGFSILHLHAFNGKIYALTRSFSVHGDVIYRLCEIIPYPNPTFALLKTENFPMLAVIGMRYVSCGEKLYVIDQVSEHPFKIHELDFGEMKWVSRENIGEKYALFCNDFNRCETFTLREVWADIRSQYRRYADNDKNGNGLLFHARMWYFFDDCLNVNRRH